MRIALDYDDTFTKDEILWTEFVKLAKRRGHSVEFVTFRHATQNNEDIFYDANCLDICITFSGRRQKSTVHKADVWIDDSPVHIPELKDIESHRDYIIKNSTPKSLSFLQSGGIILPNEVQIIESSNDEK